MSVRSAQSITTLFPTTSVSGAATDADSLPTGTLYLNGTANGASVTVTKITTGLYKAAVTMPTLAVGDVVTLVIAATVGGISANLKAWEDTKDVVIDSAGLVDANTVKVGPSGSGTAQTARDIGASVLISSGTGAGQLSVTSGKVASTIAAGDIATDAITAASVKADAVTKIQSGLALAAKMLQYFQVALRGDVDTDLATVIGEINAVIGGGSAGGYNCDVYSQEGLWTQENATSLRVQAALPTVDAGDPGGLPVLSAHGYVGATLEEIGGDTGPVNTLVANIGNLDAKSSDIKERTDNLPDDPADASDVAGQTANATGSTGPIHRTAGDTVAVSLQTFKAGQNTDADSTPTFELFKGASLTRTGSAADFTLLTGKTGRYVGAIDTTDFDAGSYRVEGTAIIGGKSVTVVCGEFLIGKAPANVQAIDDRAVTVTNDPDSGLPKAAIATS